MDEFIRQLPHDDIQLNASWPKLSDAFYKLYIDVPQTEKADVNIRVLDAFADYVLAESGELTNMKSSLVEFIVERLSEVASTSLPDLTRIFCRVLDASEIKDELNLKLLEKIFFRFQLGERLSTTSSTDSIASILTSLQKHSYLNTNVSSTILDRWKTFLSRYLLSLSDTDKNKINHLPTMIKMRGHFQELFR